MNAEQFNSRYPVGTPVFAYPGARPEDFPNATRLVTRTRSEASVLGGHTDVVWVDGHSACIALSHVDVVSESVFEAARAAETAAAVAALGALPMPVGPELRTLGMVEDELTGVNLALYEEEQENARLRLALASAQRGRRGLRARVAELEAERHVTNEALDDTIQALRKREQQDTVIAEFVAARAEYITAIRNCHPDNGHDYDRWQGHAAARRQLAGLLGLPVAWPAEDAKPADKLTRLMAPTQALRDEDPNHLRHTYRLGRDLPEMGGDHPC